ncbi:rhodanese-related sulfurtransferase [Chelativorans sp. ZYF759]|uniref:oxygen-dependent tRNA uridine(34) hydroxylase TrhO n=1 Tax=Chelativorans sp. ZYF759 TaxID=2692213 RepID=UPI00145DA509|nr:rhodanese-related sulfurtransferase [Chelativorans sp. ZYF759]NMG40290.1 rhodanese-related sulfurtransferase [Chelativorans sp. ZYF759]
MISSTPERGLLVAALYKFVPLPGFRDLRQPLLDLCLQLGIRGTLLLAEEGINGTVAGPRAAVAELIAWLEARNEIGRLDVKYAEAAEAPFHRMKVRLKQEIVTLGVEGIDPVGEAGIRIRGEEWNQLIADPETVVIDTRNDYEVKLGTFPGALDPGTQTFRDFPSWVAANRDRLEGRKIAMFCTGGIRCEKATALMRQSGFDDVYHLDGGILRYLEEMPPEENRWEGECFVFDERVAVRHGLERGEARLCRACRRPSTLEERQSPLFVEGISCVHCHDERTEADRLRYRERQRQLELAARRRSGQHMGGRK